MGEGPALPPRVVVPDRRPGDRCLRATWHADTQTVVFSHWVEGLCVASTPVSVSDAAEVARFLAGVLSTGAAVTAD